MQHLLALCLPHFCAMQPQHVWFQITLHPRSPRLLNQRECVLLADAPASGASCWNHWREEHRSLENLQIHKCRLSGTGNSKHWKDHGNSNQQHHRSVDRSGTWQRARICNAYACVTTAQSGWASNSHIPKVVNAQTCEPLQAAWAKRIASVAESCSRTRQRMGLADLWRSCACVQNKNRVRGSGAAY